MFTPEDNQTLNARVRALHDAAEAQIGAVHSVHLSLFYMKPWTADEEPKDRDFSIRIEFTSQTGPGSTTIYPQAIEASDQCPLGAVERGFQELARRREEVAA